jgi:hypothetical protein
MIVHYTQVHASSADYAADDYLQDHACRLNFPSKITWFYHVVGEVQAKGKLLIFGTSGAHHGIALRQFTAHSNITTDLVEEGIYGRMRYALCL